MGTDIDRGVCLVSTRPGWYWCGSGELHVLRCLKFAGDHDCIAVVVTARCVGFVGNGV